MVWSRVYEEGKPGNEGPQAEEDGESSIREDTHALEDPGDGQR